MGLLFRAQQLELAAIDGIAGYPEGALHPTGIGWRILFRVPTTGACQKQPAMVYMQ